MEDEYSKVLVPGDIKDRFTVPAKWMKILGRLFQNGANEALMIVDWLDYVHEFRCSRRNCGPYEKPVLQAHEWKKFVNYAGLQVDDKIILKEIPIGFRGESYKIIVQRLDGDNNWSNVELPARAAPSLLHLF